MDASWKIRARKVCTQLVDSTDGDERDRAMAEAGRLWAEVKPVLADVSSHKCWYCETKQSRAENDVDHFRPKGRVQGCSGHPGYYWLAADLANFRLSCQYCNRPGSTRTRDPEGGKADHFPLSDEAARCYLPSDDLCAEGVVLLDPTVVDDVPLLWVDEFGRAVPNPSQAPDGSLAAERVEKSVEILNLDEVRLVEERQALLQRVRTCVRTAEAAWSSGGDDRVAFRAQFSALVSMARGSSEYSLAVRCHLRELDSGPGSVPRLVLEQL